MAMLIQLIGAALSLAHICLPLLNCKLPIIHRPNRKRPAARQEALPGLPPDIANLIINQLPRPAVRAFAAASSNTLRAVLQARTDLTEFTVHPILQRAVSHLGSGTPPCQRSNMGVHCFFPRGEFWEQSADCMFRVRVPLKAAALMCGHHWQPAWFARLPAAALAYGLLSTLWVCS